MGISPLTILIGLCIGGKIFGIAGMIVGDVMAALFKVFFYDTYIEALRRKKIRDRATEKALHDAAAEIGANNAEIDLDEDLFGGKPHDEIAEQSAKERAAAQLAGRTAKKRKNKNDSKNRS